MATTNTVGPSFNTAGFDTVSADPPGSWNYRTFPGYLLRSDPTNNFNFSALKDFVVWERFVLQARADAFNALNHVRMFTPNLTPTSSWLAYITSQINTNRTGGLHLRFWCRKSTVVCNLYRLSRCRSSSNFRFDIPMTQFPIRQSCV